MGMFLSSSFYSLLIDHALNTNCLMSLMKNSILDYMNDSKVLDGFMKSKLDL